MADHVHSANPTPTSSNENPQEESHHLEEGHALSHDLRSVAPPPGVSRAEGESSGTPVSTNTAEDRAIMRAYKNTNIISDYYVENEDGTESWDVAAFREKYNIPTDVHFKFAANREEVAGSVRNVAEEGTVAIEATTIALGGLKFPKSNLLGQFLATLRVTPSQLHVNAYRLILGVVKLGEILGEELTLDDLFTCYTTSWDSEKMELKMAPRLPQNLLVIGLCLWIKGFKPSSMIFWGN